MVVIFFLPTAETGVTHDRTGSPSRCTVQAPHCAMPQPNLVPVRLSPSRRVQSSGVSGSTSACMVRPLTFSEIMDSSACARGSEVADHLPGDLSGSRGVPRADGLPVCDLVVDVAKVRLELADPPLEDAALLGEHGLLERRGARAPAHQLEISSHP